MPLTKTGEFLLQKEAALPGVALQRKLWEGAKKIHRMGKPVINASEGLYKGFKGVGKGVASGLGGAGRLAAKHPGVALPVMGLGLYEGSKFKDNFNKNWAHTDPKTEATYQESALPYAVPGIGGGNIKYRNEKAKEYFNNKNMFY